MNEELLYFFYDLGQYLINGITQGSIYALIALGYTMVYGIIKLINFAHGEFYMIGAFVGYYLVISGASLWIAFPAAMLGAGVVAVIIERLVYRPIRHAGRIAALISALGTSLFFQYLGQGTVGADPKTFPPVIEEISYEWGEMMISNIQIIIIITTIVLMLVLRWLVSSTRIGMAMRAVSFNHDAAELMGIDTNKIISFTFFVGAALAGAAGVLVGLYYNTIEPMMGLMPGLKAFVAAVLGGIGIIPGAALGGLVLGIVENLVTGFWASNYRDAIAFGILIIILLIKPTGLMGKNIREKV
ncbi:MAG: branched-chain amino acid ABC transporter permease [Bdellovibrionales bacterium]|nr:branched-chain amino acid ABC transporter permease [Bdellovibrionales bacterium]MBT3525132.1 branched-chain amino acid ABC transporter permease [Bdellovibrionales bacterium]MBT7668865.1 branched-chain amino acid ABC transporter permease [Bdellovibrionales bacterium]MBT7766133.1 branched-chain amino acid ABC transporter permease [Bdellovibrionales bacterium]